MFVMSRVDLMQTKLHVNLFCVYCCCKYTYHLFHFCSFLSAVDCCNNNNVIMLPDNQLWLNIMLQVKVNFS